MAAQFILLASLFIFILCLAKLKSAILLQICKVSDFCSHAHRSSLHMLLSEFMSQEKVTKIVPAAVLHSLRQNNMSVHLREVSYLMSFTFLM